MAFSRTTTGKHRRPGKVRRGRASAAGIAGVAAVGVVGSLASTASATSAPRADVHDTSLDSVAGASDHLSASIDEQARVQDVQALKAKAEQEARQAAAKAKKKADEAKRKAAAEKAEKKRDERKEEKVRAARAGGERTSLSGWVLPVEGSYISTGYQQGGGMWSSGSHTGVDFHAGMNTPVHAVAAGEIVEAGDGGAYGNNIVIKHEDGTYTQYGHLNSIGVSVGQQVKAGQQIALSGSTGNSSGPHLHFEARTGPEYGSDMDPVAYLRQHGVKV